jgi:MmyB-like transcription regulator ligand binding domain
VGELHFQHPIVGVMCLNFEVMAIYGNDGQRMVTYLATPGTPDHDAMLLPDMASPSNDELAELTEPSEADGE